MRSSRTFIAALSLAALLAGSAAQAQTATCKDDLVKADQNIHKSRSNLHKASTGAPAAKCAAYRQHVAALNGVKAVFERCDSGPNKAANAAQASSAIAEVTKQMRASCPSPAAAPAPAKKN
jgi:hypothetical protein